MVQKTVLFPIHFEFLLPAEPSQNDQRYGTTAPQNDQRCGTIAAGNAQNEILMWNRYNENEL